MVTYKFTVFARTMEELKDKGDYKVRTFHPNWKPYHVKYNVNELDTGELVAHITAEFNYA